MRVDCLDCGGIGPPKEDIRMVWAMQLIAAVRVSTIDENEQNDHIGLECQSFNRQFSSFHRKIVQA